MDRPDSEEVKRGISIRLGYADATFYCAESAKELTPFRQSPIVRSAAERELPFRSISFVDAPGHETLMATMLSGSALMDGAMLVIAASEKCPQPQTKEHLMALGLVGIKKIVIVQNKIDVVSQKEAMDNYQQIKAFVKGTVAENAPIIPLSAKKGSIWAHWCRHWTRHSQAVRILRRTGDARCPLIRYQQTRLQLEGGKRRCRRRVSIRGILREGDAIEIRPAGRRRSRNRIKWIPITTEVTSINAGDKTEKKQPRAGFLASGPTRSGPHQKRCSGRPGCRPCR